jgi:chorismate mutase
MKKSSQYQIKHKRANEKIEIFRKKIDDIDSEIIDLLGKRITLALKIGAVKNSLSMPIRSAEREQKLLESLKTMAKQKKIPPELIKKIYSQILLSSRTLQKKNQTQV